MSEGLDPTPERLAQDVLTQPVQFHHFAWAGHGDEVVHAATRELCDLLSAQLGDPDEVIERPREGAAWWWERPGRLVEVYFHRSRERTTAVCQVGVTEGTE